TSVGTNSTGKSGRRKFKGKGEPRKIAVSLEAVSRKSLPVSPVPAQLQSPDHELPQADHLESPKVDQQPAIEASVVEQPAVEEPVVAVAASPEPQPTAAPSLSELAPAAPVSAEPPPAEPVSAEPSTPEPVSTKSASAEPSPGEPAPVSLQTIANAYRDYTRKSIEEFGSFVEQLSGVRSLDKAMTVQSEFVKRAYETSVAESQKICELHNRLAKQTLDPFKGLTGKTPTTHGKS
ncbi:MAG: phasin family protein, partial [Tardiphaga sp.]